MMMIPKRGSEMTSDWLVMQAEVMNLMAPVLKTNETMKQLNR